MARQISVSKSGMMADVVEEAKRVFDDADTEGDALRRALIDWFRNRQANSKRASLGRLEECDAKILAIVTQQDARMRAIEANIKDLVRERKIVPGLPPGEPIF